MDSEQTGVSLIARIQDVASLLARGLEEPESVFRELKKLAVSDQWQTREVVATALVEIGKRHPVYVLRETRKWARVADPNIRRAAIEGLRGIVKLDPEAVRPILQALREDPELYVKKSVASVLRNASVRHPDFVLDLCRDWSRSGNLDTRWIVRNGLRKLRVSRARDVTSILGVDMPRRRSEKARQ